ncbi:MAG: hypothetical protein H6811_04480 [Phycisphaeraceae bacterium]|nr:hypothetical protein [Phycisphaeraceae bacterium]
MTRKRMLTVLAGLLVASPALAQSTRPRMLDRLRDMRPNFPNDPPPSIRSVPIPSPIVVGNPVVCRTWPSFQPGGLVVDGRYSDGNWNVGFHLGSAEFSRTVVCYPYPRNHWYPYYGYPRYADYFGDYPYYPVGYPTTRYDPRLQAALLAAAAQQSPPPAPEPKPDTPFGWGEWHMKRRELGPAMDAFREHLRQTPDDAAAQRCLAIVLLEDGRFADGVAMLRLAYGTSPALASLPLDSQLLARNGSDRLGWLVRRMATYANQADTPSSWLTEAVLMQGQGRKEQARRMLARAVDVGLDASIAGPLQAALR